MPSPDYRITPELLALTEAARAKGGLARKIFRGEAEVWKAYQKLFFADGAMRPEALTVLMDLADNAGIGKAAGGLEHEELACLEGRRRLFLHLMGRFNLSPVRVENLQRQISEEENQ